MISRYFSLGRTCLFYLVAKILLIPSSVACSQVPASLESQTQPKLVKIFGSGGYANLHAYQSGFFINKSGTVLTVWSHVLDGKISIVDSSGKRHAAKFVGMDPETELAILQTHHKPLDFFDLESNVQVASGMGIVGFSNLFGIASKNERLSVMNGVISAVTELDGKLAQFNTPYRGRVIVVDLITNNPGAAGGAVVDYSGKLVGIIGKELKDRKTGIWLNFCLPLEAAAKSAKQIESGAIQSSKPAEPAVTPIGLNDIGIELVPNVVETTRPYIDRILKKSPAGTSGLQPDDLIVFVNERPVRTIDELLKALRTIDRDLSLAITVRRGSQLLKKELSRFSGQTPTPGN